MSSSHDPKQDRASVQTGDPTADEASQKDDWAWRAALRQHPVVGPVYRVAVMVLGAVLILGGLALVPLPGPGWLIVLCGLAVLASEYAPAKRLLHFAREKLDLWEDWVRVQPWYVKLLIGLATMAFVAAALWLTFRFTGVPTWFPDPIEAFLHDVARL